MKKLKIALLFISFYLTRYWLGTGDPVGEGETVKITLPTIDFAEYSDSQTIIKRGKWVIVSDGYTAIMPGDLVRATGTHEKGRVKAAQIEVIPSKPSLADMLMVSVSYARKWAVARLQRTLPEPMASLASGILLGVKARMPREFYDALVNTGTLHVIAASGFNVMIVASVIMRLLTKYWSRASAIVGGVVGIVLYVLLAGASASVVRAGIMGSLTLIAYYFGRSAEAKRLLFVAAGLMLLIDPLLIFDIGFQLSVAATAGLLYIGPWIRILSSRAKSRDPSTTVGMTTGFLTFLTNYLYPTLAASMATIPVILWHFGRVSWISPLVNILILPVVPLIMLLSALTLVGGQVVAWLAYVPLVYMVWVIRLWG